MSHTDEVLRERLKKEARHWIDLELERFRDVGLKQSLMDLKKQSSSEFGRYITKNYQSWITNDDGPSFSVDVVEKYVVPLLQEGIQTFFIVIDCMRLDQWLMIEPVLADYYNVKKEYYYSILPTATPFSRNAIFAGEYPDVVAKLNPDLWFKSSNEFTI